MNEVTFVIALLLEKGVLNGREAKELRDTAVNGILSNSLPQMLDKVHQAVVRAAKKPIASVEVLDAKELLK